MTRRALLYTKDGDPVAACRAAEQALQSSSLSLARFWRLDKIDRGLEPWAGEACVQRFRRSLVRKREALASSGSMAT
jgi:hypothetical protein